MPARAKAMILSTANGSDQRQTQIQNNASINDLAALAFGGSIDTVLAWSTSAANSGQALGRGSTDTAVATGAFRFVITGQAATEAKAAVTTGTAVTAQTVPADTWALYVFDVPTGGTIAMLPAAANASTGYATEAAAIAACPARLTAKARIGYVTVKTKAATAWIGGTDGLAGGSSGNVASATNYYPFDGICAPTGTALTCATTGIDGACWNGGRQGILIPTVMAIGSNDYAIATTAFTFNANGVCNIAKAAITTGTAPAAATTPADKWALFCLFIPSTGTISVVTAPDNASPGYPSEQAAIGALGAMIPTASNALLGYVTVKTKAATAWIAGTDAFAGGSSGNPASITNYYPVAGVALPASGIGSVGITAAQLATGNGTILTIAQL